MLPISDAECPHPCRNITTSGTYERSYCCLSEVPRDIPATVDHVWLRGNSIRSVPAAVFSHLTRCKELYMQSNKISALDDKGITGLVSLTTLDLSDNKIPFLQAGLFTELKNLLVLILNRNRISTIYEQAFHGLWSLESLYLPGNKVSVLQPGLFKGLYNLTRIRLDNNQISLIQKGDFDSIQSIHISLITLSTNRLNHLSQDVFLNLPRLPLTLSLSLTPPLAETTNRWDCSSLCWLKHEEQHGTVTWWYNEPPVCTDGNWESLQCGDAGERVSVV